MANELKVIVYMTAIISTGYGLMKFTVPDEEQIKKRLDPALRKEYDQIKEANRQKGQHMLDLIREAAESDKPVWDFPQKKQ
ncbi:hypothetical protein BY458DRAFT_553012 [Sporodiniella umbellata]|nr:hypothetical protein BY458DRAFT_553012 [Sporodiniella umbellata]